MKNRTAGWALGVGLLVAGLGWARGAVVEPVWYTGQRVPDGNGARFADYPSFAASMSRNGVVVTEAMNDRGENLLVVYGGGELRVLLNSARLTDPDGVQHWLAGETAVSPDGRYVAGTVASDWTPAGRTSELYLWDRAGDLSQGTPVVRSATGGPLVEAWLGGVSINNDGVFHTVVMALGAGGNALYSGSASEFTRVVGQNDPLPGGGHVYGVGNMATGADGSGVFPAAADAWGNWTGIYRSVPGGGGGGVEKIVARNDPVPGIANAWFAEIYGGATVSADGRTAFVGNAVGPGVDVGSDQGIWAGASAGTLKLLAREGSPAPGEAKNFAEFSGQQMNAAGQVAFLATLAAPGSVAPTSANSIWVSDTGEGVLAKVMEVGDAAPGTGTTFGDVGLYSLSDSGLIAFQAGLADGTGRFGLWVGRPGDLQLLLLVGDLMEFNGELVRVNSVDIVGENGPAITDDGRVLAQIRYSDPGDRGGYGQALVLLSVPEPSSGGVVVGMVGVALGRRRRRRWDGLRG